MTSKYNKIATKPNELRTEIDKIVEGIGGYNQK